MHSRFYLSDVPIGVGIVGPGLIGGTLIAQVRARGAGTVGVAGWIVGLHDGLIG